jgi:hypothetical protein
MQAGRRILRAALICGSALGLIRSAHFGATQFRPCPVDGKWRRADFVSPDALTKTQLEQVESHSI